MQFEELKIKLLETYYFEDNSWLDRYCQLIIDNQKTEKQPGITQVHHIIQKAVFKAQLIDIDNSNSNLVNLKYSDHILAHYYLCYCTIGVVKAGNYHAFQMMSNIHPDNFNFTDFCKQYQIDMDTLYKRSIQYKQEHAHNKKPVIQVETGNFYPSLAAAARDCDGTNYSCISQCCAGQRKTAGGYHWQYYENYLAGEKIDITLPDTVHLVKKVICIETKEIYNNCAEAAKAVGCFSSQINGCCLGKGYTAKGYHWQYLNDYLAGKKIDLQYSYRKPVYCVELDRIFESATAAAKELHITNNISACCKGKRKTCGGYHWRYV